MSQARSFHSSFTATLFALVAALAAGIAATPPARAQGSVWIQVEARDNIRQMRERARAYTARFPDTRAFQTPNGWYAIVIGPMSRPEAARQLARLRAQGAIPGDSFITDGRSFQTQLWPLSPGTTTVAASSPPEDPPPAETETEPAPEAAPGAATAATGSAPVPDPDPAATKRLERGWSRAEKKRLQTQLDWTGYYDGAIDGVFGPATREAIRAFQKREGFQQTGYLTWDQLALLNARYAALAGDLQIETLRDEEAGIEILYPAGLLARAETDPPFVHYRPKGEGQLRLILISQPGGRAELSALYEIMESFDYVPRGGYTRRKRDWFVLSGADENVVSYSYVRLSGGALKGFTLIWPPAENALMQRLATRMYESFRPLDGRVLDPRPEAETPAVDLSVEIETEAPARSATGFFVNAEGALVTHLDNVAGCSQITIVGGAELTVLARDPETGVALLLPPAGFRPKSFALFSDQTPELGAEITIAGFSFPDVMEVATLNYGTLTDTGGGEGRRFRVSAFLEPGDTGGPVLDDRGAVLGMRLSPPPPEEGLPAYVNFALPAARITALLDRYQLSWGRAGTGESAAPEDVAFMAGDFTAKIACWP